MAPSLRGAAVLRGHRAAWGELAASAQKRGKPRPVNDTWIAACCIVDDVPLVTLNRADLEDFAHHDGLRLPGPE